MTHDEFWAAADVVEGDRVFDGNILRSESYTSDSLSAQLTVTYDDAGRIVSEIIEVI